MRILLHICCGVCAISPVERLREEGHEVVGFFYNPNIYPEEEYQRRFEVALKVTHEMRIPLKEGDYSFREWTEQAEPLKNAPEGGKRCEICFKYRLMETFQVMADYGCSSFTTTLTTSPHKPADVINRIGKEIGGERFLTRDFKKKNGFTRSMNLARHWRLYRQNYCGCIYSMGNK